MALRDEYNTSFEYMTDCSWWKVEQRRTPPLWWLCGFTQWKALSIYLQMLSCNECGMTLFILHKAGLLSMPALPGIINCTTNCLSSYQPPVIWELRVEGWLNLKGDGKCCLKWIRKAAGFIYAPSLTCTAKRKQVTVECVLKPKRNTTAQMICCHSGRSAFLEIGLVLFTDQWSVTAPAA